MQTKPVDHESTLMNKTAERINVTRISSHTVDNLADDVSKILAAEDIDEIESPKHFQIMQPKMKSPPISSQKKLSPQGSRKTLTKQPSKHLKRKSRLGKAGDEVKPWANEDKVLRQQSVLSFARLNGDTDDDDAGPIVKDNDSVEFLL